MEKARGRVEAQFLEHHETPEPHQPTLQEQRIAALNLRLIHSDDSSVRRQLVQTRYDAELQLDDSSLAGQTATHLVPLNTLQRNLRPTELVIEYVLNTFHSYAMAIMRHSAHVHKLPARTVIKGQVSEYRRLLRNRKRNTVPAPPLFHELLFPIPEYRNKFSIIVVPDGDLHLLPFFSIDGSGTLCDS